MKTPTKPFAVIAVALLLGACDNNDAPGFTPVTPPGPTAEVQVQFIHAVANAPTVTIGNPVATFASGLAFKESTGFAPDNVGSLTVQIDADVPGGQVTVVPLTSVPLVADTTYSVLAIGEVGSMNNPIAPLVIANPDTPVTAGNVRVEVVHASPNAGNVDIYVTGPSDSLAPGMAIAGGDTPFGANSGPLEVPAGDYRIRVTAPMSQTPVFDSGTVALPAGADLLVVAVDNTVAGRRAVDAPPITLLVADGTGTFEILDANTPAEVRVVHAVSDVNLVDVYVNDPMAMNTPAIEDLDYPRVIPTPVAAGPDSYLALTAGTNNVLVTVADDPGIVAIPATDLDLAAGTQYTVYASGTLAGGIAPYITVDDDRSIATEAKTRIVHLSPAAGLVDIYVTAPGADIVPLDPTFEDVDFGDETGYVSLAGGTYDVTVTLANMKDPAIGPATITLSDGSVYTAVARDPDVDIAMDPFGLILLDDF